MKKSKIRIFVYLMAAVFCTAAFSVNALASGNGKITSSSSQSESASKASTTPLTPDGTGTVIDNVTNEDGKEFFTITTPSKHIFYLIIDRQKNAENVYFLDAVTDRDLLALAKNDGEDVSTPETSSSPVVSTPSVSSTSRPEKQNNSAGIAAVTVLAAVLIGAAVWFFKFKFRKPSKKDKNRPDPDDYDYTGDDDEESGPEDEPEVPDGEAEQKDEPETSDGETEHEDE